jgi:hypothetical protein
MSCILPTHSSTEDLTLPHMLLKSLSPIRLNDWQDFLLPVGSIQNPLRRADSELGNKMTVHNQNSLPHLTQYFADFLFGFPQLSQYLILA